MEQILSNFVRIIHKVTPLFCTGHVLVMYQLCTGHVLVMYQLCTGRVVVMYMLYYYYRHAMRKLGNSSVVGMCWLCTGHGVVR